MATNMYIKFDDLKGESEEAGHKDWTEILSWNHGFSQPASPIRTSTGSTVERANHNDLKITKYVDSATYALIKNCWVGKQFENVNIECMRADGDNEPIVYLKVEMEDVIIASFNISGGGGSIPIENIDLSYGKIQYVYNPKKKEDGTAAGEMKTSHDLATNKVE